MPALSQNLFECTNSNTFSIELAFFKTFCKGFHLLPFHATPSKCTLELYISLNLRLFDILKYEMSIYFEMKGRLKLGCRPQDPQRRYKCCANLGPLLIC